MGSLIPSVSMCKMIRVCHTASPLVTAPPPISLNVLYHLKLFNSADSWIMVNVSLAFCCLSIHRRVCQYVRGKGWCDLYVMLHSQFQHKGCIHWKGLQLSSDESPRVFTILVYIPCLALQQINCGLLSISDNCEHSHVSTIIPSIWQYGPCIGWLFKISRWVLSQPLF